MKDHSDEKDTSIKKRIELLFRKEEFPIEDKEKILKWVTYFEKKLKEENES
ncbi:MAG: hypothetical protein ABIK73_09035 [candidate division WOR-3 bacterium]